MRSTGSYGAMKQPVLKTLAFSVIAAVTSFAVQPSASSAGEVEQAAPPQTRISDTISVQRAYELSLARKIHLVDIRRPDEWKETGVATTAHAITMHQNIYGFLRQLRKISPSLAGQPIALICARGFRSRYMQRILRNHGVARVVDVSEGMLGSSARPGWLQSNLPTKPWEPD